MHDSASRWLIVETGKAFQSYVKYFFEIFQFFNFEKNCRMLTGLCK